MSPMTQSKRCFSLTIVWSSNEIHHCVAHIHTLFIGHLFCASLIHFKHDRNCIKLPLGPIGFCYVRRYPADMYNKSIEHSVIQNWLVRWDKQHQGTNMLSSK